MQYSIPYIYTMTYEAKRHRPARRVIFAQKMNELINFRGAALRYVTARTCYAKCQKTVVLARRVT